MSQEYSSGFGIDTDSTFAANSDQLVPSEKAVKTALALKAPLASPTFTGTVTTPAIIVSSETASRVAIIDASKNIKSADTATYPSLTELAYIKGVTSAIQTQIDLINNTNIDNIVVKAYKALGSGVKAMTLNMGVDTMSGTANMFTGLCTFVACYLNTAQTITGVRWWQANVGSYTANNNNKVGLYSYSGGTLTLVASSTNDGNIFQSGGNNQFQNKDFSATYSASAGIYFIAFLWNRSAVATTPSLGLGPAVANTNNYIFDFTNSAKLFGTVSGQTDLPATQAMSGVTTVNAKYFMSLY